MAGSTEKNVVLLPIKPKYAEAIKNGHKTIEFRKKEFSRKVKYIVVYSSNPKQEIIGFFEIDNIETDSPKNLWDKYYKVAGIESKSYNEYYNNSKKAVGIKIKKFHSLNKSIKLYELKVGLKAPQSFCYLEPSYFEFIKEYMVDSNNFDHAEKY